VAGDPRTGDRWADDVSFIVTAPPTRGPERQYVLDVVLREWLGLEYELVIGEGPYVSIARRDDPTGSTLRMRDLLFSTPDEAWLSAASLPSAPVGLVRPTFDGHRADGVARPLPILYGEPGLELGAGLWRRSPRSLELAIDIFGSVFFLLTRYEEVVRTARDRHGRFGSDQSILGRDGFLDRPIADELVDLLWYGMSELWPGLQRPAPAFRLRLTHDVDHPWSVAGRPAWTVARSLAADLALRHDVRLAVRRSRSAMATVDEKVGQDPLERFDLFMDAAERHGIRSTFYFHAGSTPLDFDYRYRPTDAFVAPLLRRIHDRGHEIGLHTSYVSHGSLERTRHEFEALLEACASLGIEQRSWGVRQHYLRLEIPLTWRIHEAVGLEHDSTLGFHDRMGFRAGTGREYPVFDLTERRALSLRERPLLAMDTTMMQYMHLGLDLAMSRVRGLVQECRTHGGDAVLLYHNNTMPGTRFEEHYRDLVDALLA